MVEVLYLLFYEFSTYAFSIRFSKLKKRVKKRVRCMAKNVYSHSYMSLFDNLFETMETYKELTPLPFAAVTASALPRRFLMIL